MMHNKMSSKMPSGGMGTMDYRNFKKKAYGGLAESNEVIEKEAEKTDKDYDGNEKERLDMMRESEGENFAKGGMAKGKIMAAHKKAKEAMPEFQKEYGKEKGKEIAYATMMKQEKMGMAEGGKAYMAEGGKAKPAVMAIVARLKKGGPEGEAGPSEIGEKEEMGESESSMEGHSVAADEIMSAIKAGDREGLVSALKNFYEMCKMGE